MYSDLRDQIFLGIETQEMWLAYKKTNMILIKSAFQANGGVSYKTKHIKSSTEKNNDSTQFGPVRLQSTPSSMPPPLLGLFLHDLLPLPRGQDAELPLVSRQANPCPSTLRESFGGAALAQLVQAIRHQNGRGDE
jgi:hypothetical protein